VHWTCAAQRKQFDASWAEYNAERPHDALGGDSPGSRYSPSSRPHPERLPTPEYPAFPGEARDRRRHVPLPAAAAVHRERLGESAHRLEAIDDGVWPTDVNTVLLATPQRSLGCWRE